MAEEEVTIHTRKRGGDRAGQEGWERGGGKREICEREKERHRVRGA